MTVMGRLAWTGMRERRCTKARGWEVQPSKTLLGRDAAADRAAILIGAVAYWNSAQAAREQDRTDQQRQDTAVTSYFVQMSGLMLHERLLRSSLTSR